MSYVTLFDNKKYRDLNPFCLGREECKPNHSFGPAIRSNYLIHYVIKGRGTLSTKNGTYPVKSGQLFLIKPKEVTRYVADEKNPWEYMWIEFNGEIASKLEEIKNPVISCDDILFQNMWESRDKKDFREEYIISNLFLLVPMLLGSRTPQSSAIKIQNYIQSNYMYDIKIDELAKNMGYSRQHISRVFKNETGMTIQRFLLNMRLYNSKKLLEQGFSVSETAYMCGYNDVFNFSKGFKSKYKISPSMWKKQEHDENVNIPIA